MRVTCRERRPLWAQICLSFAILCTLSVFGAPRLAHAESNARIMARLAAIERENAELRAEVRQQKQEFEEFRQRSEAASQNQNAQVTELNQKVTASAEALPRIESQVDYVQQRQVDQPVKVGFRTGWAESPYDMPGGFFYGAYLADRLLTHEDGIPGGYISGELMAGIVLGNHTNTPANLVGQLTGKPSYSYLDTIEIQPTAQYHLDFATLGMRQLAALKPYALIGPGIWISTLSTPLVVHGSVPGEKYRHSDADVQPGGVYGLGFELALSELDAPPIQKILNRLSVGGEWRYNGLANGEGFQQYTGSLAIGF
jgi:hypothetical protein